MSNVTINSLPTASTIDGVQDILPIYTASATATQGINRNTLLGLSSAPIGLTDSQTLTNKTLTSPTINGATLSGTLSGTYTIGGTPTFPSSVTTLTGTQTLTNKTLTSPTINAPTITNATISADTITGYTTSNNGTIYGIGVTAGQISSGSSLANGIITSTQIATNGVAGSNLATTAITLGYSSITSNLTTTSTSYTNATGLSVSATVPSGGRRVKVTVSGSFFSNTNNGVGIYTQIIVDGTTVIGGLTLTTPGAGYGVNPTFICSHTPSSGSHTYQLQFKTDANTITLGASSTQPFFILVEAI